MVVARVVMGGAILLFVGWYTVGVWQMMDQFFGDQYKVHLKTLRDKKPTVDKVKGPAVNDFAKAVECPADLSLGSDCYQETLTAYVTSQIQPSPDTPDSPQE